MRKYDIDLLRQIKEKEELVVLDGLETLMKHIPDDDRKGVMDPRVLKIAQNKLKMFSERAKKGYSLSNERYRPDKVTYDLCTKEIIQDERLIKVDNHMIDIFIYRAKDLDDKCPVLVYFHGGGGTAGDIKLFENQMRYIAELSNAVVVFPEYRLAPENPYPAANEDAIGTIKYVIDNADDLNVDKDKLMVAGDSFGTSLINSCLLKDDDNVIKKAFEIYPAFDSTRLSELKMYDWSYDYYDIDASQEKEIKSRIERIKANADKEAKDSLVIQGLSDYDNPLISVVYAKDEQLKKFPPMTIFVSEFDYLRISSDYFAKRLKELGVEVKYVRYCGCDHGIFDLLGILPQAEDICLSIAEEIKKLC